MRIAVDVFGGDHAPGEIMEGCARALGRGEDFSLLLTGDEKRVREEADRLRMDMRRLEIVHAPDVIANEEHPVSAVKTKTESSLVKALKLVAEKRADIMLSAGSTGAVLAGGTLIVKRIPGVKRPALAPLLPTAKGSVLLIDCGANVDCKSVYLEQFALMGDVYMRMVEGVERPRIGLINNGAEAEKGNALTKEAYQLLAALPVNFVGNAEGRDILSGDFDVVVCDGFVGNALMKFLEGTAVTLMDMLKQEIMRDKRSMLGAKLMKNTFRRFKNRLDYAEYGGSLFLGLQGGVIKMHGSSKARAVEVTVLQALHFAKAGVTERIWEAIGKSLTTQDASDA